jgi:hypothetical protein
VCPGSRGKTTAEGGLLKLRLVKVAVPCIDPGDGDMQARAGIGEYLDLVPVDKIGRVFQGNNAALHAGKVKAEVRPLNIRTARAEGGLVKLVGWFDAHIAVN